MTEQSWSRFVFFSLQNWILSEYDQAFSNKHFKSKSFSSRDDDIDGTWEAPSVDNPLCKDAPGCGEWTAPLIPNPAYKGPWRAPLVDNPNYSVCEF